MLARVPPALVVLGVGVALAGCYASTEPATKITVNDAVLNARGTANEGAAYSYFEYWPTATPSDKRQTGQQEWPAGASGPFSDSADQLAVATSYDFHVCGGNQGQPPVCAQTRSFQTVRPTRDIVKGAALGPFPFGSTHNQLITDASTDASGANPTGTMKAFNFSSESVTCVRVEGNRAAIGAVGQYFAESPVDDGPEAVLVQIADGGASGTDTFGQDVTQGGTPPNCLSAAFSNLAPLRGSNIVVYDAH